MSNFAAFISGNSLPRGGFTFSGFRAGLLGKGDDFSSLEDFVAALRAEGCEVRNAMPYKMYEKIVNWACGCEEA